LIKKNSSKAKKDPPPRERKNLPAKTREAVLTEAGYRCAVPTCRTILTLDIHHIDEVSHGGGDVVLNLIALCPNCHRLYHTGTIPRDAIYAYKAMLVAISRAFDLDAVDRLLFLNACPKDFLIVSGDGLLHFARVIAAGLATVELKANNNWQIVTYAVNISGKGKLIIDAWRQGDRARLSQVLGRPVTGGDSSGALPAAKV